MKWVGQHIWGLISRFRSDVYFETVPDGIIDSGKSLGLDTTNKLVKATAATGGGGSGDLTEVIAGTGLSGTNLTGPIPTLNVEADQGHITSVGTIGTGVWQGTTIKTAYIGNDQITEDKLADTILADIDANTAKVGFPNGMTYSSETLQIGDNDQGLATVIRQGHSDGVGGDLTIHSGNGGGVDAAGGDLLLEAGQSTGDKGGGSIIFWSSPSGGSGGVDTIRSNARIGSLDNIGNLSVNGNILPGITLIKILPKDFIADDGGRPLGIVDSSSGVRFLGSHGANPMFASVDIPLGFKATSVNIYGDGTSAIQVYEASIDSRSVTSIGIGQIGSSLNITDVTASTSNYLLIELVQTSGEQVTGGRVVIEKA